MLPTAELPFADSKRYLPGDLTPLGLMHIVDREVGGEFLLNPEEKDLFRDLLRNIAAFAGLEVLTSTCLDNPYDWPARIPLGCRHH